MRRHDTSDRLYYSSIARDKVKKELDDYIASIVVPCAEDPKDYDEVQDGGPTVYTCGPVGKQEPNYFSSSEDDESSSEDDEVEE